MIFCVSSRSNSTPEPKLGIVGMSTTSFPQICDDAGDANPAVDETVTENANDEASGTACPKEMKLEDLPAVTLPGFDGLP